MRLGRRSLVVDVLPQQHHQKALWAVYQDSAPALSTLHGQACFYGGQIWAELGANSGKERLDRGAHHGPQPEVVACMSSLVLLPCTGDQRAHEQERAMLVVLTETLLHC